MIVEIRTYGRRSDPYRKIHEYRRIVGDVLHVEVRVYLWAYVEVVEVPVSFGPPLLLERKDPPREP